MEDTINQIDGHVQIVFTKGTEGQLFTDALWMSQAEYDTTSAEAVEATKQARYNNWLAIITAMHAAATAAAEAEVAEAARLQQE